MRLFSAILWGRMAPSPPPSAGRSAPPNPPNYWARRLGVFAVVGIIGYAAVVAVGAFLGSDDDVADARPPRRSPPRVPPERQMWRRWRAQRSTVPIRTIRELCDELGFGDNVTFDVGDATPEGDVETTNSDEVGGEPTRTRPVRPRLTIRRRSTSSATLMLARSVRISRRCSTARWSPRPISTTRVSSGLARPDFFNWPTELEQKIPEVDPDIVVVTFGGNDSQGLSLPQDELEFIVGDPLANEAEWSDEYERRAGEVMDLLLENDRHVIWVGIPNDDNPDVTAKLAIQDRAAKAAAAARPDVVFVDTWARFSGRDGGWAEFVVDPRDKEGKDVRADDGFHLNQNGAEILAIDIAIEVQKALRSMGAPI